MITTPRDLSSHYLWFDTEYTSLELDQARLLQVALVITDANLQRIAPANRDFQMLVRLPDGERCSPWAEENLKPLLARCRSNTAHPLESVQQALAQYLDDLLGPNPPSIKHRPPLAGNSLQADWFLARKYLPSLIDRAHYRVLDVSSWKVFWKNALGDFPFDKENEPLLRQYFPGEFNSSAEAHDAHFDVLASIAELNFYKTHQKILWPATPA